LTVSRTKERAAIFDPRQRAAANWSPFCWPAVLQARCAWSEQALTGGLATSRLQSEGTMATSRKALVLALLAAFVLGAANRSSATGNIVKSDLKGTWNIAAHGVKDCGSFSALVTGTLGTTGSGPATLQTHSSSCGDQTLTGQTLTVTKLSTKGAGTTTLTCGSGCVLTFDVQVAPDRSKFNFVTGAADAGTFMEGIGVRASDDHNVVMPDVKGDWQLTFIGLTDCGVTSVVSSFSSTPPVRRRPIPSRSTLHRAATARTPARRSRSLR
jgi:hypothetical protein